MPKYYPKSQIKPNLYTNGDEYTLLDTGEIYKGYYFKTSTGQAFSGRNYNDLPNIELVPLNDNSLSIDSRALIPESTRIYLNTEYLSLQSSAIAPKTFLPYYLPQLPTQQDYQIGTFRRYFCKKANELIYIEIDEKQYEKLTKSDPQILWQLYLPFDILWTLTGDKQQVAKTNRNLVALTQQNLKLYQFNLYLKEDYLKYYQFTNASNLYTAGGEYKTADGKNYIGYYHIHDKTGPMVGATHIKEPHGLLFPINENISTKHNQSSQMRTQTTSSYTPPSNNYSPPSIGGGGGGY